MTQGLLLALTLAAAIGSGLVAGIFFAFSNFVMEALSRLPPAGGIAAMQSINVTVLNPLFLSVFMGTALLCGGLVIFSVMRWSEPGAVYLLAGSLIYFCGSLLVTMLFNVPLNDALAAVDPGSTAGAELWTRYLSNWTFWNHVRTAMSLAAFIAFIFALDAHARVP